MALTLWAESWYQGLEKKYKRRTIEWPFVTTKIMVYVMPTGTGAAASCNQINICFSEEHLAMVFGQQGLMNSTSLSCIETRFSKLKAPPSFYYTRMA